MGKRVVVFETSYERQERTDYALKHQIYSGGEVLQYVMYAIAQKQAKNKNKNTFSYLISSISPFISLGNRC
jgi:hypothetical protein